MEDLTLNILVAVQQLPEGRRSPYMHELRSMVGSLLGEAEFDLEFVDIGGGVVSSNELLSRVYERLRGGLPHLLLTDDFAVLAEDSLPTCLPRVYFTPHIWHPNSLKTIIVPVLNPQKQQKGMEYVLNLAEAFSYRVEILYKSLESESSIGFSLGRDEEAERQLICDRWIRKAVDRGVQVSLLTDHTQDDFSQRIIQTIRNHVFGVLAMDPYYMDSYFRKRMMRQILRHTVPLVWLTQAPVPAIPLSANRKPFLYRSAA